MSLQTLLTRPCIAACIGPTARTFVDGRCHPPSTEVTMGRDVPPASLAVAESRSTLRTTPRMADTATMKKLLVVVALAAGCYGPRPQAWVGSPELVESVPVARTSTRSDRKSTRLNSSHSQISYAVFCLKKKKKNSKRTETTS